MSGSRLTRLARLCAGLFLGMATVPAVAAPDPIFKVRRTTDGPGPSHLLTIGNYILVVDPLEAKIFRYSADSFASEGADAQSCEFGRAFSPWRSVTTPTGIWLVDEADESAMLLTPASVGAMNGSSCPAATRRNTAQTAPPVFNRSLSGQQVTLANPAGGKRLEINAPRKGYILDARLLGHLRDGRSVVFWKQLDSLPRWDKDAAAATYDTQGRVVVVLNISVFDCGGNEIGSARVRDFSFEPADGGGHAATFAGMSKRGFEYIALGGDGSLYGLTSGKAPGTGDSAFIVKRLVLPATRSAADIVLQGDVTVTQNEGSEAPGNPEPISERAALPGKAWDKALDTAANAYIEVRWWMPAGGRNAPCGDKVECDVMYRSGRLVALDPAAIDGVGTRAVTQTGNNGPVWKRPTYLYEVKDGDAVIGMPYSYGGSTNVAQLKRVAPDPAQGIPADYTGVPFGHIVELLKTAGGFADGTYPIGIDCSRFVSRLLAELSQTSDFVDDGKPLRIGEGFYPVPVEHPSDLKAGDILIKHGHVVIYAGTYTIGYPNTGPKSKAAGLAHGAIGYVVYEASSRCGRVCRSIYPLDFFDGWWMLRPKKMKSAGGLDNPNGLPQWKSRKAPIGYPAP